MESHQPTSSAHKTLKASHCLVRVGKVFRPYHQDLWRELKAPSPLPLAPEYFLLKGVTFNAAPPPLALSLLRWQLPIHHAWPCRPQKIDSFIEKAALALTQKFAPHAPQTVLVGPLESSPTQTYFKNLAANLRGRLLQLFPPLPVPAQEIESQNPNRPTLYVMVGASGLYAGLATPRETRGFYAGGVKYIRQNSPQSISRAGAKVVEALHHLQLYRTPRAKKYHWLELGASPGGMTAELLRRGHAVTAVDRAPLDPRLDRARDLLYHQSDVSEFHPRPDQRFDALLCDLNGPPAAAYHQVCRLSSQLTTGAPIILTLKLPHENKLSGILQLIRSLEEKTTHSPLQLITITHLFHNRHELTAFLEKT